MELSRRQRTLLHLAVELYVRDGRPVSSGRVAAAQRGEPLSSATIRNVMKDLERFGLMEQRHASAGRVPTELGMRTYVDQIMCPRLHPWDRTHLQAACENGADDPRTRAVNLTQRLAGISGLLAVVALPKLETARLQQVTLTRVASGNLVTHLLSVDGTMHRSEIALDVDLTHEEVRRVQSMLNERLASRTLAEVRALLQAELQHDSTRCDHLRRTALEVGMRAISIAPGSLSQAELVVEGMSLIARQPEFADVGRLHDLLRVIDDKALLLKLLDGIAHGGSQVTVVLGGEHQFASLVHVACVGSSCASPVGAAVTLLGPTRMDYERLVPMVACAAELLGKAWA